MRGCYQAAVAAIRLAEGNARDALAAAELAFAERAAFGIASQYVKLGVLHGVEAALELGDTDKAEEMLGVVEAEPIGLRPPLLAATVDRFRARLGGDDATAERLYAAAEATLRQAVVPFHLAVVLVDHAEWLAARGRSADAETLVEEARETFARLEATPWLKRVERLAADELREIPA